MILKMKLAKTLAKMNSKLQETKDKAPQETKLKLQKAPTAIIEKLIPQKIRKMLMNLTPRKTKRTQEVREMAECFQRAMVVSRWIHS